MFQILTLLSRRFKKVFQLNELKNFLIFVVELIKSNLAELNLFEKYNLQNLNVQRLFLLSLNIDRHRKLINIFFFEEMKDIRRKRLIEMINIIIFEFKNIFKENSQRFLRMIN